MIKITMPDGSIKEFKKGITAIDVAKSISEQLAKMAICVSINNCLTDLSTKLMNDCNLKIITSKDKESLHVLRHTTAHVFAQAVLRLFPKAKITIGPVIENGFYYDVDCDKLNEQVLPKIEKEMQNIINENLEISINYKTKEEALKFFKNNEYKKEIIEDITTGQLSNEEKEETAFQDNKLKFYKQENTKNKKILEEYKEDLDSFEDMCKGPHLPNTGLIKAFKLDKITKAYWRADAKNKQLNRVYGTAFWKKSDMDEYYRLLEEAKKRDHRIIGKQMKLFMNHEYAPGMTFFLPKGFIIYRELQNLIRSEYKLRDYKEVMTPNIFNKKLWEISGHWQHYKEDMFSLNIEGQQFSLKPMNCPSHCLIFKNDSKSYKDLPLRIADFGALHRNELSGALSGLTRVRKFCQDDAHIFCRVEQIEDEIDNLLGFVDYIYKDIFKMSYEIEISTRPEGFLGKIDIWNKAEKALQNAVIRNNKNYKICEGDGAFYGPKIDFRIKDCMNRVHQTATIQLDFNLPERFELKYEGEDNLQHQPVMIHRAILGSVERFMAIILEHFAGKLPLWLSAVQIKILNVADRHKNYCEEIKKRLEEKRFRVETDYSNEKIGKKIAVTLEQDKPNYILILGDKDIENNTISVRTRKFVNGKNEEFTTKFDQFLEMILKERENKEIKN